MLQQTSITDDTTTCDGSNSTVQSPEASTLVAAPKSMTLPSPLDAASTLPCTIQAASSGESVTSLSAVQKNTVGATAHTTSLFAKLSGELRNRIYRAYFEDFQEERYDLDHGTLKDMAPDPLALLQTNRMLRSEAGSIFYEEFAPFEQIPFAYHRETPDVVVNRIRALCTLLAMRDVNTWITVLCSLNQNGCISDNECGVAVFSARTLPAFIADETGDAVVSKAFDDRPGEEEEEELDEDDIGCGTCAVEDCYEARIGDDFSIKHRGHGPPKPPSDGCFLYLEGPLARLNWDHVFNHI